MDSKTKKRTLRICFLGRFNPSEILTGPEKVAKRLFEEIRRRNHNAVFVEYFFEGNRYSLFKKLFGYEIVPHTGNVTIIRCGILRLNSVLFKLRPEILHVANFERFAVFSLIYRFLSKAKLVYTVHGIVKHEEMHFRGNIPRFLQLKDRICEKLYMTFSDKVIFLSEQSRQIASSYYSLEEERTIIHPNGIDAVFHLKSSEKKRKSEKRVSLVFIGDPMRVEKGYRFLIDALSQCTPVDLFVVGPERYAEIPALRNGSKVICTGNLSTDELAAFLRCKDIYVSASINDSFLLAAVEAMASGLAPVVTKETGMSRYIRDGENGFVVPYGNVEQLASALKRLIKNKTLRRRIGGRAREIYSELSWDKVADRVEDVYRSLF